jgi:hypothetical protein
VAVLSGCASSAVDVESVLVRPSPIAFAIGTLDQLPHSTRNALYAISATTRLSARMQAMT